MAIKIVEYRTPYGHIGHRIVEAGQDPAMDEILWEGKPFSPSLHQLVGEGRAVAERRLKMILRERPLYDLANLVEEAVK